MFGVGCGSKQEMANESMSYDEASPYEEVSEAAPEGFGNDEVKYGGVQTNRKVIQSAYIQMETLTFDESVNAVKDMTYEFKGYFENMQVDGKRMDRADNEQYRDANFTIRIPKDKYEYFLNAFEKLGNIINNELSSEDITDRYIDTEAHVKALLVQEERLLEILKTATKIEDIIQLEERLSQVRYEIEGYTGTIRQWDNLVDFTTIVLRISEVQEVTAPKPETTLSRAIASFLDSTAEVIDIIKGFIVFLFGFVPFLVILVPLGYVVRYFMKRHKMKTPFKMGNPLKKHKKNNEE